MKRVMLCVAAGFLLVGCGGGAKHPTGVHSEAKLVQNVLCFKDSTEWVYNNTHQCVRNGEAYSEAKLVPNAICSKDSTEWVYNNTRKCVRNGEAYSEAKLVPNDICPKDSTEWQHPSMRQEWKNTRKCVRNGAVFLIRRFDGDVLEYEEIWLNPRVYTIAEWDRSRFIKTEYKDGKRHGKYEVRFRSSTGRLTKTGEYRNGRKHGKWTEYKWSSYYGNRVEQVEHYDKGEFIKTE